MAISNLKPGTTYAIHMRRPSKGAGGGTADWVGSVTSNGEVHAFWGKTGSINQRAGKTGNMTTLQEIIDEKKQKGYSVVDEYAPQNGWLSQQQQTQSQSQPDTSIPQLPPKPTGPPVNLIKTQVQVVTPAVPTPIAPSAPLVWDF